MVILDEGRVVAEGAPVDLRQRVGGILVELNLARADDAAAARAALQPVASGAIVGPATGTQLRIPVADPECLATVVRLLDAASIPFRGLTLHEATLDDVFLALTGHAITPTPQEAS